MAFLKLFGNNNENASNLINGGGNVVNFELLTFMREAFGNNIICLDKFRIAEYAIDFLLIDNDLLVTHGLSAHKMVSRNSEKNFELAIRVPFKWQSHSNLPRHTWFIKLIQTIITQAINGVKPICNGYVKTYDSPFYYISDLNSVTLFKFAQKSLKNGVTVNFLMVVPLYESELEDGYYLQPSSDLKGLAWQQASLLRGNEYFDTLDNYYPYDDTDTEALSDYFAIRDEALPGWSPDNDAVGCRVASCIVNSKNKIGYLYRTKPENDFSGWYFLETDSAFFLDTDNLPIDFYADSDSDLFTIAFLFPQIAPLLRALPGTAYELQPNGSYQVVK